MALLQQQKKKRTKGGRYSNEITKEEIEQYYHLPCEEASRHLGIGLTILKRICRRLGIEKWPYRALKRAAKLGEAGGAAAAAAAATSGGSKRSGASASPATSSPLDAAAVRNGEELSPGSVAQPAFRWDGPEVPKAASSGDTGDSWQAQQAKRSPPAQLTAAQRLAAGGGSSASPLARQGSGPAPASRPAGNKASPPLPRRQAGESRRRGSLDRGRDGERGRTVAAAAAPGSAADRRSLDLGVLARGAGRTLSPSPESSGGGGSGTSGLQRAPSGGLKRIREQDVLMAALGQSGEAVDAPPNPFALASTGAADEGQPAGACGGAQDAATDQLAAGLSRLEMRTLSLKRQCSRDDTALDALDQALLMERLAVQDPRRPPLHGLARALSMPSAQQRLSPPIPQFGVKQAAPTAAPQGGWLALEQLRLLPRSPQRHAALPQACPQPRAELAPFAAGPDQQLDVLAGPFDSEPPLLSDPSLAAMLFGMPLPSPKASVADIVTESCLLPDLSPPSDSLPRNGSSGLLLVCGEQGGPLQHASSSGSARLLPGASRTDALDREQAPAAALQQHRLAGEAAKNAPAVTAVGPASSSGVERGLPTRPLGSNVNLLSPFGDVNDHEVEDLLADFLNPVPTSPSDPLGDLVLPLTPTGVRTGSADDALAGLMPSTGAAAPAQPPPDAAADPTAAAALDPPSASAFAGTALAPGDAHLLGELQFSAGSPLSGGGMGSGSIQSYDTPTSTGAMALPLPTDLPLSASDGTMQLAAKLLADPDPVKHAFAAELLQQAQARQAARQQVPPLLLSAAPPQPPQPVVPDWRRLEPQLAAQLAPAAQPLPLAAPSAPASHQGKQSLAALAQELQQAVQAHREAQQRYLLHREQVRTMLLQRQLGPSGSPDRVAQLARLKQLKLQLAAAQQKQNELRAAYEAQLQQQQPQQQQPLVISGQQPWAFDASAARLGPPPPLPPASRLQGLASVGGMPGMGQPAAPAQHAAYGQQALLQELLAQPDLAPNSGVMALMHEWAAEPGAAALPSAQLPGAWPATVAAAGWGALPQQTLQPHLAVQQLPQGQPGRLAVAQRAASAPAPLPFDFDWSSMLP